MQGRWLINCGNLQLNNVEKMIKVEQEEALPRGLTKSPLRVTERIRQCVLQYPNAKPKDIAEMLGLDHNKYANMISVEKSRIRSHYGLGRPHRPHRRVWTSRLAAEDLHACNFNKRSERD